MKLPKIIFFDIDDTLYIKYDNVVPSSTIEALHTLKNKGIIVAIATGRGRSVFPPQIDRLIDEVGIEVLITINGQYIEYQGQALATFALSNEQITHTTNYLLEQRIAYAYMTATHIYALKDSQALKDALTSLHIPYRYISAQELVPYPPIYQILAFYDDNRHITLPLLPSLKTTRWHTSGVDILDKDGSKARGIQVVLDKLGIEIKDAWAFGDGLNDIEMLEAVGFGVAMGNGHPELKAVADFVAPTIKEEGIAKALRHLGVI